ncbi:hypothetical protein ACHAXS_007992 [Conticribra weissflogii]
MSSPQTVYRSKKSSSFRREETHGAKNVAGFRSPRKPVGNTNQTLKGSVKARGSYYENRDFGSMWLTEFLSYERTRHETLAKADLNNFTTLPGSTVHPHAEKRLAHQAKQSTKKKTTLGGNESSISDRDRKLLNDLSKTLLTKKTKTKIIARNTRSLTPYIEANMKLSRVLKHKKPRCYKDGMQASQLEDFYKLVSEEAAAAIVIQSQCRRVLATEYVRQLAFETETAIIIQSQVRMFLAKKLLKRMKDELRRAQLLREKYVRVFIARCQMRKRMKLEHDSAVLCQSAMRMFSAKLVLKSKILQNSWEVNQRRWIALSIRLSWKNLRIYINARKIQCVARRRLTKTRVISMQRDMTKAALQIQNMWRSYYARLYRKQISYDFMVDQRRHKIRIMLSEVLYWKQRVNDLNQPSNLKLREDLERQKSELEAKQNELKDKIIVLESHYKEQVEIQQQLTPRSIEGGWEEQVGINLENTREELTRAKQELLFIVRKKLLDVSTQIDEIQMEEDEAVSNVNHFSLQRQIEQNDLWDIQRQYEREKQKALKRKRIVDEQMKWAVKFYMPSGKPDKRKPLLYFQKNNGNEFDIVQQYLETIQGKTDELQVKQYIASVFKPFQRVWDSFDDLVSGDGLNSLILDKRNVQGNKKVKIPLNSLLDDSKCKDGAAPSVAGSNMFTKKLPWNLMKQAREEREEIMSKFGVQTFGE